MYLKSFFPWLEEPKSSFFLTLPKYSLLVVLLHLANEGKILLLLLHTNNLQLYLLLDEFIP
jgi:hypothetical protein